MLPGPFGQIFAAMDVDPVPAHGACDTRKCHDAGVDRSAPAVTHSVDHPAVIASSGRHDRQERCSLRNELLGSRRAVNVGLITAAQAGAKRGFLRH